jgi:hypothetical protein
MRIHSSSPPPFSDYNYFCFISLHLNCPSPAVEEPCPLRIELDRGGERKGK